MSHATPGDVKTQPRRKHAHMSSAVSLVRVSHDTTDVPQLGTGWSPNPGRCPPGMTAGRTRTRGAGSSVCEQRGARAETGWGWGVVFPAGRPLPQGVNHMLTFTNCSRDRMAFLQGDRPAGAQARLPRTEPHWGVDGSPHGDFCLGGQGAGGPQAGGTQDSRLTASPGGPGPGF